MNNNSPGPKIQPCLNVCIAFLYTNAMLVLRACDNVIGIVSIGEYCEKHPANVIFNFFARTSQMADYIPYHLIFPWIFKIKVKKHNYLELNEMCTVRYCTGILRLSI